ncbi:MAG TPA: DUF2182 domain-containing protein [Acidimicrobiales bacterium]|nr:DUF2182 domain-containing protein [Acidimicrobiales bacterium]
MIGGQLSLRRLTPQAGAVLVAAAGAWLLLASLARGMGAMPGTMGLGIAAFVGVWTLMMAAMMLPSVAPLASMYARSFTTARMRRLCVFALGYLAVWAVAALPAFGAAWLAGQLAGSNRAVATAMASFVFVACGLYQLTPFKDRCLARCRSPLAQLLYYGNYRGATRDLRVGLHHGAYCFGCCWALMGLLIAFGVMNVTAMVAIAGVVLIEKVWTQGKGFTRFTGVIALALALIVIWVPALAPGLHSSPMGHMS